MNTAQDVARRARNGLDVQRTAVVNGLFTDGALSEGQLVKVAIAERYRPREVTPAGATVAAPAP